MTRWPGVVVAAAIAGVASIGAQVPPPRPAAAGQAQLPAGGLILGQVVDAASGQAIAGVTVTLTGGSGPMGGVVDQRVMALVERGLASPEQLGQSGTRRAMTDADGRFLFRDLTRGSYSASASLEGYAPGAFGRRRPEGPSRPIELADNEKVTDATIRLWKLAAISGRIADEAGEPVVGITLRALRRYYVAGRPRLGNALTAETDDRGIYRVSSVPPGDYIVVVPFETTTFPAAASDQERAAAELGPSGERLRARAESGAPMPTGGIRIGDLIVGTTTGANGASVRPVTTIDGRVMVYPTSYFPGATSLGEATLLTVGSGEERTGVNLTIRPMPATRVSGTVTGPDGPAANLGVRLFPADTSSLASESGSEIATALTDAAGRFTFLGVPAGRYTARAYRMTQSGLRGRGAAPPAASPTLWAETPVTVGDTPAVDLALALRPGGTVSGHLVFDGTAPKPTPQQLQQISISVAPADGRMPATPQTPVRPDANGRFVTTGHPPGQYTITASPPSRDWAVKAITLGATNFLERPLVLDGTDLDDIVVTYTDRAAELSGTLQGIPPNSDEIFSVLLFPADPKWLESGILVRRPMSIPVAKAGTFQVRLPIPGEYLAVAISQDFAAEQTPAFMATLARMATRVSIAEGDRKTISLSVSRVK